jgi:hypothetical protein
MSILTQGRQVGPLAERLHSLVGSEVATGGGARAVSIVDQFLVTAAEFGGFQCRLVNGNALGFWAQGQLLCQVPVRAAKGVLRSLCARLAKVIQERSGQEFEPYGNDVEFDTEVTPGKRVHLRIAFTNTTAHQEFTIEARPA